MAGLNKSCAVLPFLFVYSLFFCLYLPLSPPVVGGQSINLHGIISTKRKNEE